MHYKSEESSWLEEQLLKAMSAFVARVKCCSFTSYSYLCNSDSLPLWYYSQYVLYQLCKRT